MCCDLCLLCCAVCFKVAERKRVSLRLPNSVVLGIEPKVWFILYKSTALRFILSLLMFDLGVGGAGSQAHTATYALPLLNHLCSECYCVYCSSAFIAAHLIQFILKCDPYSFKWFHIYNLLVFSSMLLVMRCF